MTDRARERARLTGELGFLRSCPAEFRGNVYLSFPREGRTNDRQGPGNPFPFRINDRCSAWDLQAYLFDPFRSKLERRNDVRRVIEHKLSLGYEGRVHYGTA